MCTCQTNLIGTPPNCRPECVVSSECRLDMACLRQKCIDPCPGTCGQNAECRVVNHSPVCSCINGYIGDPFSRCHLQPIREPTVINPCDPSPCGPNSICRVVGDSPACSCLPDYFGTPPNCRPECAINPDCMSSKACSHQKCVDPCPGVCGINAECNVINHTPRCNCINGYTGDPYIKCNLPGESSLLFILLIII